MDYDPHLWDSLVVYSTNSKDLHIFKDVNLFQDNITRFTNEYKGEEVTRHLTALVFIDIMALVNQFEISLQTDSY